MKIAKTRNVRTPSRGTKGSAGLDFYVPEFDSKFHEDFKQINTKENFSIFKNHISLKPHEKILIPSGIKAKIPENYMLTAYNKGGVASKKGLVVGGCVVDADFTGEIFISLINTTDKPCEIISGEKIVQFILVPILMDEVQEVPEKELFDNFNSERGEGCLGSTNSKN